LQPGGANMKPYPLAWFFLVPFVTACAGDDDGGPAGTPDAGGTDSDATPGCTPDPGPAEADPELGLCAGDGWCFANPLPQPNLVTSLYATSPDDIWGAAGRAFHWNGTAWSGLDGDPRALDRVIGVGADDLWFGGSILAHFKNGELTRYDDAVPPEESVFAMFRVADDDVWALGSAGLALHWNGDTWQPKTMPSGADFATVWGNRPDNLWAIGAGTPDSPGTRMHWNGSNWTQIDGDAPCTFLEVWGDSTERGWGRCRTGELEYWNGDAFVEVPDPAPGDPVEVAGSADSAFAADGTGRVAHWNGDSWATVLEGSLADDRIGFYSIRALAADDVLVGGDYGAIARCSPAACTWLAGGPDSVRFSMKSAWAAAESDVWAVGDGIAHFDGHTWHPVDAPLTGRLQAVHGTSATDVWAVGDQVVHYDGCEWTALDISGATDKPLGAVWALAPDDVWAVGGEVGDGVAVHFDGAAWTAYPMPGQMSGVWGSASDRVWAVGQDGTIMRWDGSAWSAEGGWSGDPLVWFEAVWGTADGDVWLVGEKDYRGFIARRAGDEWTAAPPRRQPDWFLYALGGSGPDDIWAAGNFGRVMHWNGEAWTEPSDLVIQGALEGIAIGANHSWLVGDWGVVLHHD
jgi:hypothetical protein